MPINVYTVTNIETGYPWKTPNGKKFWSRKGDAKRSMRCHITPSRQDDYQITCWELTNPTSV